MQKQINQLIHLPFWPKMGWVIFLPIFGTFSLTTTLRRKGKAERPIEPVKRFIESGFFHSRSHLRRELLRYIQEENEKVHSTIWELPAERLAKEQEFLRPLPEKSLELARVERQRSI